MNDKSNLTISGARNENVIHFVFFIYGIGVSGITLDGWHGREQPGMEVCMEAPRRSVSICGKPLAPGSHL